VLTVNGREVTSLEGFRRLMQDLFLRDPMQLTVERRGERVTLTLPAAQPVSYQ
jgi:S1-C subfamily serine protease